jgi:hypothetical protein
MRGNPTTANRASARVLAAAVLVALLALIPSRAGSQEQPADVPRPVMEAIETSPAPKLEQVIVGAYINDIQQLDFKTNNYVIDLYVWFRWTSSDIDPSKSMEFMNRYASDDNRRDELMDAPEKLPDGSLYSIIRYQGLFSTKFPLEAYPFDTQILKVIMEDTLAGAADQVYVPDGKTPVVIDPVITLPASRSASPRCGSPSTPIPRTSATRRYLRPSPIRASSCRFR